MRYRVIQEHDRRDPIRLMCRALAVSPAGYYAWRGRPESRRVAANRTLLAAIRALHQDSRQTYGSPSIWCELVYHRHDATRAEATQDIFEYIEVFYNRTRRHSTLGYHSPVEYESRTAVA